MERYAKYRDSGIAWIGEIPEHWNSKKLKYLATLNDESLPETTEELYEIEYIEISNVKSGLGILETEKYFFKDAPSRARRIVKDGDVIVSTVRTYLKSIAKINNPPNNLIASTGFAVVRPRSINSEFTGFLFYSEFLIGEIISLSTGVSYPAINASQIGHIYIPIPPLEEQKAIAAFLDRKTAEIDELIALYEEEKTAIINEAVTKGINPDVKLKPTAIARFVSLHPHNLAQKTEIIIERFRRIVAHKIGGRAKAMLVTSSRLHAKRYFEEFNRYITAKGYGNEIKVLVAFSGKVKDHEFPDDRYPEGVSEPQLTGVREKELPNTFNQDEYKILIVADKYQTGFDQPLLHTMYVDKSLSGVKAVQTLSRLNRMTPGKEDTFVLDFVNTRETIFESFQPYYELTTLKEEPDPNHLYDLKGRLDQYQIYLTSEIEAFAQVYFDPNAKMTAKTQGKLYALLEPAGDRYKALEPENKQDEFKKGLRTWTNLYSFLSQIMPFHDADLEKFFVYGKLLLTKLPKRNLSEVFQLADEVALEYYRLDKIKEGAIGLVQGESGELETLTEAGIKRTKEEKAPLSIIIDKLNDRFGTEFEDADRLFFEQIESELIQDETLKAQAQANQLDTFKYAFEETFITKLIERMEQNQEIFQRILEDDTFGSLVKDLMMRSVYNRLNQDETA